MHLRRWIILGAITPGLAVIARSIAHAALLVLVVAGAAAVASALHRGPDPRIVRAACASRAASQRARSLVSIASIPRRSEAVAVITAAWDAEAQAWADAPVECE